MSKKTQGTAKPEPTLNKFGDPSYGSPQSAIMGKMGLELPRQGPPPMPPGWMALTGLMKKGRRKR